MSTVFRPIDFKDRFSALDGIRAIAVTFVFIFHYGGGGTHGGHLMNLFNAVRWRLAFGVDLFFVLSGFLITGILFDTTGDSQYFKRFFARRSVRIFPVYYLVFLVILILGIFAHYTWHWGQLWFLAYLGNFFGYANHGYNAFEINSTVHPALSITLDHFWSLCVEEQFYVLFPFLVWFIRDRKKLMAAIAGLCVLAVLLRLGSWYWMGPANAETWTERTLPFRMDTLLFGSLLALALRSPAADRIQRSMKWIFLVFLIPAVYVYARQDVYKSELYITLGLSFVSLACMGFIGVALRQGTLLFRFLTLPPLRYLGKYSYGFYVWHYVFATASGTMLHALGARMGYAVGGALTLTTVFACTFLAAKLSYDLFEKRFLSIKRHFEYDSELRTHRTAFAPDGN